MCVVNVNVNAPAPAPAALPWTKAMRKAAMRMHAARNRAAGFPLCSKCEGRLDLDERGVLHADRCYSCDQGWLERRILRRLVVRLGRGGAVEALKRLVRESK